MLRRAGLLLVLGGIAVAGFAIQHARSDFLRIEGQRDLAAEIAAEVGLETVEVLALHELGGAGLDERGWRARAARFAAARKRLGADDRALFEVFGREDRLLVVRFDSMRARFAARESR